jgi:hypothetical protein
LRNEKDTKQEIIVAVLSDRVNELDDSAVVMIMQAEAKIKFGQNIT